MAENSRDDRILQGLASLENNVKAETGVLRDGLERLTGRVDGMATSINVVLGAMAILGCLVVYAATQLYSISSDVGEIRGRQEATPAVLQEINETLKRIDEKITATPETLKPKSLGWNFAIDPKGYALLTVGVDGKELPAIVATTKSVYTALQSGSLLDSLEKAPTQGNIIFVSEDASLTKAMKAALDQK